MLSKKSRIFVTGHEGLVGSSVVRRLKYFGYKNILTIKKKKLDLRNQAKVKLFFKKTRCHITVLNPYLFLHQLFFR